MPGFNNDRFLHDATTSLISDTVKTGDMTTTTTTIFYPTTTTISAAIAPVPKDLLILQHHHQDHPHQLKRHRQRQGKMYDQDADLMDALPPEVFDQILLSFDQATLLACATLSRRWSRRCLPYLWYRPWTYYYFLWRQIVQTLTDGCGRSSGSGNGGRGGLVVVGDVRPLPPVLAGDAITTMMMETEDENEKDGSNPHPAIGSAQHLQQQRQRQQEHFGSSGLGIMATTSIDTIHTAAIPPHRQPQTLLFQKPTQFTASYNYGDMIRVLDFTELHSILNDKFLAHVLPCVKSLQELIIVSPNQLSDESLFAIGSNCRRLVRLELRGCTKVSDKGTEAVFGNCVKLRTVVLANVVGNSSGSSRASSSNNSLALTHTTLDHLSNHSNKAPTIKLHTLNLANGLRFPTSGQVDPLSAQSLTNLIHTHTLTLVSVTLSFCGPAVTDTVLSHFSTSLLHLNLAFCFEVTDAGITALARTSPNLQDLDITGLTQVSDKGILAIGQHCPDFWQLAMVDEQHLQLQLQLQQQQQQGRGGQWANQNPLITDEVLNCFPWGARIVQRRDELLGQKKSPRIF